MKPDEFLKQFLDKAKEHAHVDSLDLQKAIHDPLHLAKRCGLQRQFKFRYWDTEKNRMFPVRELSAVLGRFPVMQFTGIVDRDKREIYEGDILELTDKQIQWFGAGRRYVLVAYKQGGFMFGRSDLDPTYLNSYMWKLDKEYHSEDEGGASIAGNIFENHLLLFNYKLNDVSGINKWTTSTG